jgi:CHASE2 domain-containing sensor protein
MLRKAAIGIGLGVLAALLVLAIAASSDLLDRYELTTYDWRMRLAAQPQSVNKDIVFLEINDFSIRQLQMGYHMRWPWPRVAIGLAIEFLRRAPAKVVAVDVTFPERDYVVTYIFDDPKDEWSGFNSDEHLADNVRNSGGGGGTNGTRSMTPSPVGTSLRWITFHAIVALCSSLARTSKAASRSCSPARTLRTK